MSNVNLNPDFLFEVSWEVCNKVGGIHTVIASKAPIVAGAMGDNYITIGPDFSQDSVNPEFSEDNSLMAAWRESLYNQGVRVRIGRWNIEGRPIAILIDFKSFFSQKDTILSKLWEDYNVDSLSGQWDYVEPVLFGYAAGVVIASYAETMCTPSQKVVAHFHEWMASAGSLYLHKYAPYVATLFTTHATVMGRCIAGNRLPLYNDLLKFNADELARQFNVVAKHSLEKSAAAHSDAFLTVSEITANECRYLIGREVTRITPNGFDNGFVPRGEELAAKRSAARKKLIEVAEASWGVELNNPLIVATSGRYEYRNKGIDVFLESLKQLASSSLDRDVLAVVAVPAANIGMRQDLAQHLENKESAIDPAQKRWLTHNLESEAWDLVSQSIEGSILSTSASRVKVLFVPTYLNGNDGIFNMPYYDVLAGVDLTVFASYYEPWGYTPLESVAYGVPTVTTTLAGFGLWVANHSNRAGVDVVRRDDYNEREVVFQITEIMKRYLTMSEAQYEATREAAMELSNTAVWKKLYNEYKRAYEEAIENSISRTNRVLIDGGNRGEQINFVRQQLTSNRPQWHRLMVEKGIPERLKPLEELSRNLWWCWTPGAQELFEAADKELWVKVDRNPIALLDKISAQRYEEILADKAFLKKMDEVYKQFCDYMSEKPSPEHAKVAYFSMEYGLHSSLKIYSGGLGILAGDYLKEASDRNVPMVAVGLLYRYGYFTQRLSAQGAQEATYEAQNFFKLPISPVRDELGNWVTTQVALPGRNLTARVWKCQVGRTDLFLLDADYEANLDEDRQVTYYLYGGDWENRLKQEILLGVGGIRALVKMGIKQEVYHCNEGHAAFINIERIRNLIARKRLSFSEAMEVVRSSSLFTTHTPVPAGHDAFPESMIRQYMSHYPDVLGITWDQFINLGKTNPSDPNEKFSMSVLACNLSQEVNGVSWLHGEVSKDILGNMWPGYFKNELHIGYVTNGVHFPTWVASNLRKLYAKYFGEAFEGHTYNIPEWQNVHKIDDKELWSERMFLKERLIKTIRKRFSDPTQVRLQSPRQMVQVTESIKPEVLTIGFARRFATYKRAHLLFTNLERLSALVNNKERPVQFIFAGKAHPNDKPGQDLIKRIVEVSAMPEFVGKIVFLQNYDMELARRMVQGVDVWLNTPTRPLEASGTSGEKCVMNGVMQFSVLDGWWVEGYKEGAGWMLPMERTYADQRFQDELDAEMIYNTIEEQIVPLYYDRAEDGVPHRWVNAVKKCVADIASNFTTNRMLIDYEERFYNKLAQRKKLMLDKNYIMARQIAAWKRKVSAAWDNIVIRDVKRAEIESEAMYVGKKYHFELTIDLAGLQKEDIGAELVVATQIEAGQAANVVETRRLEIVASDDKSVTLALDYAPEHTGMFDVALRVFPVNDNLEHRMDFALVKWA
ncbi:MAG: alpha-glucan family phosphorylase [Alistipes sp.]|nr:alpha-glucan family phosphorylase [Alistipes sp.]MBR6631736.1 alpha-glucan family phosphorylase [Alistipes sp.]